MRLNKWLYGAMALGMMTACSDHDVIQTPDDPTNEVVTGQTTQGYIAVEIKLPTETSTRGENDKFQDGLKAEYAVQNAMIVLFKGTDEKTATFYRVKDLTKPFFDNLPDKDNITSSYLAAIDVETIPGKEETDNFYALVILNRNEEKLLITPADEEKGTKPSVTIADVKLTVGTSKFSDFLNVETENSFLGDDGKSRFFMTNAPLLRKISPSTEPNLTSADVKAANIRYLTNIGNKVYDTPEQAKENLSGCVYVERAVAKVTYDENGFNNQAIKLAFYTYNENEERIAIPAENVTGTATVRYLLTNTNKKSYVVRNVDFSNAETSDDHFDWDIISDQAKAPYNTYRMVSLTAMPGLSNPFHSDDQALYRTYWCKDPNYASTMPESEKNVVTREQAESTTGNPFKSLNTPMYCKENTFDVANQKYGNSTLAVFEVNFDIKQNGVSVPHLFIKDGDKTKIYLTKEDAAYAEITRLVKSTAVEDAIKAAVKSGVTGTVPNIRKFLKVDMSRGKDKDGKQTQELMLTNVSLKTKAQYTEGLADEAKTAAETLYDTYFDGSSVDKFRTSIGKAVPDKDEDGKVLESENLTLYNLLGSLNQLSEITEYTNGVSYYVKPIMHFGEEYTPWDEAITGTTTSEVYNGGNDFKTSDDHAKRYLGRYGVVRNNWYELNINEIKALGTPTFPDIDVELANDNNEQKKYFAVEIHVLSWAKRTQGIKF